MKITVSNEAATWYKDELINDSPFIRFFPRYGGGGHIPGFAIAVIDDKPEIALFQTTIDNITFYVEEKDAWFFDGISIDVGWDDILEEPKINIIQ